MGRAIWDGFFIYAGRENLIPRQSWNAFLIFSENANPARGLFHLLNTPLLGDDTTASSMEWKVKLDTLAVVQIFQIRKIVNKYVSLLVRLGCLLVEVVA